MSSPFQNTKNVGFVHKSKVLAGILLKKAFVGPYMVAIQGSYRCNYRCVFCEWFSPLLKEQKNKVSNTHGYMTTEVFKGLIKELSEIGTKIVLIGDVEPFMDPELIKKIEFAKHHNLQVIIITNGSFLTEEIVKQLIDLKLDYLNVSLNAGTPETYPRIHVTESKETFERIVSMISFIEKIKKEQGTSFPQTRLSMVVCNKNYQDIVKFVELCKHIGVKNAHLKQLVFPASNEIGNELELTPKQARERDGDIKEALTFAQKHDINVDIEWADWFSSQKSDLKNDKMPCYYGWVLSMIENDGNVYACCFQNNSQLGSFGNINNESFSKIWFSKKYQDFRKKYKNINDRKIMGYYCNQAACFFNNKQVSDILHKPYLLPFRPLI